MTKPEGRCLPGDKSAYENYYLILAGLFIAALVACNLIFQKFFSWKVSLFGWSYTFQLSVGILPYPLTFLVTDILSEIYGKHRAAKVVTAGLCASLFVIGLILIADTVTAAPWSPVDDATFHRVFGLSWVAVAASMAAYLVAQYLDIRFFSFWRRLTRGRHLWLRNNASTVTSQVLDTAVVNGLLVVMGAPGLTWARFPQLFWNGVLFKWLVALADTPLFYAAVALLRRKFPSEVNLVQEEEEARRDPELRNQSSSIE
jgi:uncharacterized integral membrane protein (TIGR00697 family)